MGALKEEAMRPSGDDTPRETPAAKGSDSRISVAPPAPESSPPPTSTSSHPAWMNETTRRERKMGEGAVTRAEGRARVVHVKVHGAVAAVFVLTLATLVLGTMLMVFVFAMGVGVALALGIVASAVVFLGGRVAVGRLRGRGHG
jgi:hypothetical protein